jgi:hypothetical protein
MVFFSVSTPIPNCTAKPINAVTPKMGLNIKTNAKKIKGEKPLTGHEATSNKPDNNARSNNRNVFFIDDLF